MSLRNAGFALSLLMVAAVTAGCLWGSPSAGTLVGRATGNALEADTVHFELKMELEGDIDPDDLEFANTKLRGAIDQGSGRSILVIEMFDLELEVRTVDGMTYLNLGDGSWMKMEADEFAELAEFLVPLFDPYAILDELGVDPDSVKRDGSDEIRGKKADRYVIDVPARKIDQDVDSFMELTDDTTVSYWIGEDDLPVRIVIESRGDGDDFDVSAKGEVVARLTIDLFDYGKPVDVEAPPAEDIVERDDFGFGGDYEDPFEGAECYGERVEECLDVNPEAEAMAQDPIVCQSFDVRVCLVPLGSVRADILQAVVDFHKQTKNIDVVLLPGIPLTRDHLDLPNSQLPTAEMYELMKSKYITTGTASTFIGISAIDQQMEGGGWWFGQRFHLSGFSHQHGVFSYFRMANVEPYNGDPITDELVRLRVSKYVARYTALLLLDYPFTEDNDYLNYYEMYGFSDLDSMGTKWPEGDPPCLSLQPLVCIVPDQKYDDPTFGSDVEVAAKRIARETGIRVEVRADTLTAAYAPTKPDWGREFAGDLDIVLRKPYHYRQFPIVGVTDDNLAQDSSVSPKIDEPHPMVNLSIVSGHGAGKPGTREHQERLYRLILRGVLVAYFGMELNDDPGSLMFRGITTPAELDGKVIPAIPPIP